MAILLLLMSKQMTFTKWRHYSHEKKTGTFIRFYATFAENKFCSFCLRVRCCKCLLYYVDRMMKGNSTMLLTLEITKWILIDTLISVAKANFFPLAYNVNPLKKVTFNGTFCAEVYLDETWQIWIFYLAVSQTHNQ